MRLGRENVEHELADEPGAVRGEHGETDGWGEGELGLDHPQEPDGGRHDQPEHVLDCQCLAACGGRGVGVGTHEKRAVMMPLVSMSSGLRPQQELSFERSQTGFLSRS